MPARGIAVLILLVGMAGWSVPAWSEGTVAGTEIPNTATVDYEAGGSDQETISNTVVLIVDEVLDVTVVSNDPDNIDVTSPDINEPLSFTVTNTGNGSEPYELTVEDVAGDDFNPVNRRIYIDDGDGEFDEGDTLYAFNGNDPVLAPDESVLVFIVSDIEGGLSGDDLGTLSLRATAVTAGATGNDPGTIFNGQGDDGSDAVVGMTTASATAEGSYEVGEVQVSIVKSQTVQDNSGAPAASAGATVNYTLTLTVTGDGEIENARIVDAIPEGTTYQPGSLTLDSGSGPVAQTDALDADEGRFDTSVSPNRIDFDLGDVPAGETRIVTFRVTIN